MVIEACGSKCQSDTINLKINFDQFLKNSALRAFETLHTFVYLFQIQLSFDWNFHFPVCMHFYILEEINGKIIQKLMHKALSSTPISGRCFEENRQVRNSHLIW